MTEILEIKLKKLNKDSEEFTMAHSDDACYDIYAYCENGSIELLPKVVTKIPTGIAMAIPIGYEGAVRPRSGWSLREPNLRIANTPGTIDSGYRNEVCILMHNMSDKSIWIHKGQRIAQIGIRSVPKTRIVIVDTVEELGTTERGQKGFGSSGK